MRPEPPPHDGPDSPVGPPYPLAVRRATTARNAAVRILRDDAALWCVVSEQPALAAGGRWELLIERVEGSYRATSYPARWMLLSEGELRDVLREVTPHSGW